MLERTVHKVTTAVYKVLTNTVGVLYTPFPHTKLLQIINVKVKLSPCLTN
jgi:hypothetical protein